MSSKVYPPGDEQPVSAMAWRQVGQTVLHAGNAPPDRAALQAQLESEHSERVRQAHAAGLREGETAGRDRAVAEIQPVLERLARSLQEIANLKARLRWEAEADLVRLALAIARRVIRRELSADPDAVRGLALAALEKLQAQEISRVKVHPAHAAVLKSCLAQAAGGSPIEVISDPSSEPGSVVFETARGNLDASVDAQLQEIERGLADRLRRQP